MNKTQPKHSEISHYFEYSNAGVDVVEDGLKELGFGEFLVEIQVITRQELFLALQMQDRHPGVRIGECVAALGFMPYSKIQDHLESWNHVAVVEA